MTTPAEALTEVSAALDARLVAFQARLGEEGSTAYPYVTTYVAAPVPSSRDAGDSRRRLLFSINTVTVGATEAQCRLMLGLVVNAFHRFRPDVGERSWRLVATGSMPVEPDDTLPDRRLWIGRNAWSLTVLI